MTDVAGRFASTFASDPVVKHGNLAYDVYRGGTGKPMILLHELDGFTDPLKALALQFVNAGFEVHAPKFWDQEGVIAGARQICVRKEFIGWATGVTSPVASWVRAQALHIAQDRASRGNDAKVGVVGMCLTGNIALAAIAQPEVAAAVAAQPAMPWASPATVFPKSRERDLGLSEQNRNDVAAALASGQAHVAPLRFRFDMQCPAARVEAIAALPGADPVHWLPGFGHSTLTSAHRRKRRKVRARSEAAFEHVVGFLQQHL